MHRPLCSPLEHQVVQGWLRGLKVIGAAVVAFALPGMARNLAPDARRATIAVAEAIAILLWCAPRDLALDLAAGRYPL